MPMPRRTLTGAALSGVLVAVALTLPALVLAANITVTTIPGQGWIQAPDNTAGRSAVIVAGPAGGLGTGSVELTSTASSDFVGIGRQTLGSLSGITGGSWMTFATGATGNPVSEPASLRFGMFRDGLSEFTTVSIELSNNGGVTPGVWQTTTWNDQSIVWQTNPTGNFCLITSPCTLAAFKTQYPNANGIGLQVAIGTGVPPVTTFVDGVSLTIDGVTDTWDFELPAAPTPTPATPTPATPTPAPGTPGPTQAPASGNLPATSTLPPDNPSSDGGLWTVAAVVTLAAFVGSVTIVFGRTPARASKRRR